MIFFDIRTAKKITGYILLATMLAGCNFLWKEAPESDLLHDYIGHEQEYLFIDGNLEADPLFLAFINENARELRTYMGRFVVKSNGVIERGQPESPLGNLTADIIRNRATREMGFQVDIAVLNRGGLRIPLPEGDVTVGTIYELMPFENHITMLKMSGRQIRQLANEIAREGGEPVSGMRFRIENGRAVDLLVAGTSINDNRQYWVATNNWLADGGGPMPSLWNPLERRDLDVLIREAFIEYLRHRPEISPVTDNRVRH